MRYLVLDLEMTGTEPGWHEIIEIGACLCDERWNVLDTYLEQIYPENREGFSVSAQRVHDLSLEELEDAPMLHEVLPDFEDWIVETLLPNRKNITAADKEIVLRDVVICGQSVVNDINFLRFAYRKEKIRWPFSNTMLDLHSLSYYFFEILRHNNKIPPESRSLKAIAGFFGLKREGDFHDALEDATLTAKCFKEVFHYVDKLKIQSL